MMSLSWMTIIFSQQSTEEQGVSWLQTIHSGGVVGYIILALSVVALALVVMHLVQIRRVALLPPHQIEELDAMLERGDAQAALDYCLEPANDTYLTRILSSGLTRFQKSAFGVFEIKNAIEEAGEDQTARLYRSTDALGVIGSTAPLLGLLGTVFGMVGAFQSLSRTAQDHEALASSISLALVTTLEGLIVAIPCIALYSFFRNRIDTFASEAGMEIERLVLHLEASGSAVTATSTSAARRSGSSPRIGQPPITRPPSPGTSSASGSSAGSTT